MIDAVRTRREDVVVVELRSDDCARVDLINEYPLKPQSDCFTVWIVGNIHYGRHYHLNGHLIRKLCQEMGLMSRNFLDQGVPQREVVVHGRVHTT